MGANRVLRSSQVVNIEDLRHLAQRRLPKSVFDYLDGGAEAELTLAENCRAFRDVIFRPRGAVAVADCNLKTKDQSGTSFTCSVDVKQPKAPSIWPAASASRH